MSEHDETMASPEVETQVIEAPTLEAALEQAAEQWRVSVDDLDAEVLTDEKRLFGLLGKKMTVRVRTKAPLMHIHGLGFARSIVRQADWDLDASLDDNLIINLDGEDSAIVIGRHGETLKALEFLTNLIYRSDQGMPKIRFDCGGYRARREESLTRLAESVARDVAQRRVPISLEPMSSWERRIIHLALQEDESITTSSEGEEPFRKIVVHPAGQPERRRPFRRRRRS